MMKLRILGGTPPNHDTHLCDTCAHRNILRGSHMDEARCEARVGANGGNLLIRGRIHVCTDYRPPTRLSGTRYRDAYVIANIPEFGPVFLSPSEILQYDERGNLPDRYLFPPTEKDGDGNGNPSRTRRSRRRRTPRIF